MTDNSGDNLADVRDDVAAAFAAAGLRDQLDSAARWLEAASWLINSQRTFVSSAPVVDVLSELPYDPHDDVYVVWRADGASDFWSQSRRERYLGYLQRRAEESDGSINQQRLMVYDDRRPTAAPTPADVLPPDHIFFSLLPLHKAGSFLSIPRSTLRGFPLVEELRFGYTLSERYGFAVIAVPFAEDLNPRDLAPTTIGSFLEDHREYDTHDGPMRAVVTVDAKYVRSLLDQTKRLACDPAAEPR